MFAYLYDLNLKELSLFLEMTENEVNEILSKNGVCDENIARSIANKMKINLEDLFI